jgi:cysteine desulfurase
MKLPIYMDHHATTPVDPRVLEAMLPYFSETFGNAASRNHSFGWEAEAAVDAARAQVAEAIGAKPREIVFTSGATESINLALKGLAERAAARGKHVITWQTEHRAVLDTCRHLEKLGFRVSYLPVKSDGLLDLGVLERAITPETILISLLYANNEIGVIQPVAAAGKIAREKGIVFHVDGVQALGKVPVNVERGHIDLLSITAHKLYGPKGVGALYVRRGRDKVDLAPQIDGGGHERGFRSGTLNVPGIVGFGKACEVSIAGMAEEARRLAALRDRLKDGLFAQLEDISINGSITERLPHNLHLSFSGVDGESLLLGLDDVAVSSGSACTTASPEPSHVLRALGVPPKLAHASIRFGLGRFTTEEEVDYVIAKVVRVVNRLRELSPLPRKG